MRCRRLLSRLLCARKLLIRRGFHSQQASKYKKRANCSLKQTNGGTTAYHQYTPVVLRHLVGGATLAPQSSLLFSLLPSFSLLVLVKLSSSLASSVSSEASSNDLPKRKLPAIGSSSEEKESTFSSKEEKSSPQDASSSSSSSSAPKRSARSSPSVRDSSSSDWKWKSHSSAS
jgi:hypothetical protein